MSNMSGNAVWSLAFKVAGAEGITREISSIAGAFAGLDARQTGFGNMAVSMWTKYKGQLDSVREKMQKLQSIESNAAIQQTRLRYSAAGDKLLLSFQQGTTTPAQIAAYRKLQHEVAALDRVKTQLAATSAKEAAMARNIGFATMAGGYVAVAAAASAATIAYARWTESLEKSIMPYARAETNIRGMRKALLETRETAGASMATIAQAQQIAISTRTDARLTGQAGNLTRGAGMMTKAFGVGEKEATAAIEEVAFGSFKRMEKETGLTVERIAALLSSVGEKADFSTVEGRMKAANRAMVLSNEEAAKLAENSWSEWAKRVGLKIKGAVTFVGNAIEDSTGINNALKTALGAKTNTADPSGADNERTKKMTAIKTALDSQNQLVLNQRGIVRGLNLEWSEVSDSIQAMSDSAASAAEHLRSVTVMGTAYGEQTLRVAQLQKRAAEAEDKRDFRRSSQLHTEASGVLTGKAEEAIKRHTSLTGFEKIGGKDVFVGRITDPRERYVAQQREDAMMKETKSKTFEEMRDKLKKQAQDEADSAKTAAGKAGGEQAPEIAELQKKLLEATTELRTLEKALSELKQEIAKALGEDKRLADMAKEDANFIAAWKTANTALVNNKTNGVAKGIRDGWSMIQKSLNPKAEVTEARKISAAFDKAGLARGQSAEDAAGAKQLFPNLSRTKQFQNMMGVDRNRNKMADELMEGYRAPMQLAAPDKRKAYIEQIEKDIEQVGRMMKQNGASVASSVMVEQMLRDKLDALIEAVRSNAPPAQDASPRT